MNKKIYNLITRELPHAFKYIGFVELLGAGMSRVLKLYDKGSFLNVLSRLYYCLIK